MPARNVVLTDRQEAFVGELVTSGRYQNASEVLQEGLRLLEERTERRQAELDMIRGLRESLEQEARGDFAPGSAEDGIRRTFARGSVGQTT